MAHFRPQPFGRRSGSNWVEEINRMLKEMQKNGKRNGANDEMV